MIHDLELDEDTVADDADVVSDADAMSVGSPRPALSMLTEPDVVSDILPEVGDAVVPPPLLPTCGLAVSTLATSLPPVTAAAWIFQ